MSHAAHARARRALVADSRFRLSFLTLAIRTATINCRIKRENMEEIYLEGPLGNTDIRIINSYPSKVEHACPELQKSAKVRKSPRQKSPQDRTQQSRHSAVRKADSYLAPGAIEKHVAAPETGVVAFPSSREKLVTLA